MEQHLSFGEVRGGEVERRMIDISKWKFSNLLLNAKAILEAFRLHFDLKLRSSLEHRQLTYEGRSFGGEMCGRDDVSTPLKILVFFFNFIFWVSAVLENVLEFRWWVRHLGCSKTLQDCFLILNTENTNSRIIDHIFNLILQFASYFHYFAALFSGTDVVDNSSL